MTEPAEGQSRIIEGQSRIIVRETEDLDRRLLLERMRMSLEAGWLGIIFGSATNAPTNIAGIVVSLLTLTCIAVPFIKSDIETAEWLKIIALPVITLVLGYLFGKST